MHAGSNARITATSHPRLAIATLVCATLAFAAACGTDASRETRDTGEHDKPAQATSAVRASASPAEPSGDARRGRELVARFQCNRCHEGTGTGEPAARQACVGCHESILDGRRPVRADAIDRIRRELVSLRFAPSLASAGARLRPSFIADLLLNPHDLRPALPAMMPRLGIAPDEARDIAAYLTDDAPPRAPLALDPNDVDEGRALVEQKGCGSCHALDGFAGAATTSLPSAGEAETRRAVALAPALRHVRDRSTPAAVVAWLDNPAAVKPDTPMPRVPMTSDEERAIASYLFYAPLAPEPAVAIPPRLPLLDRRVSFDEVDRRVFRNTCRHCHGDPDAVRGDGGPGTSGGFGFEPRGLRFTSYEAVSAGLLDAAGRRQSVFARVTNGAPRLVAALLARQKELAGHPDPEVRGMPLGLPPLAPEDIQLVETWVAQGRPR